MTRLCKQARRALKHVLASWSRAFRLAFLLAVMAIVIHYVGPQICDLIEATNQSVVTDFAEAIVKVYEAEHR